MGQRGGENDHLTSKKEGHPALGAAAADGRAPGVFVAPSSAGAGKSPLAAPRNEETALKRLYGTHPGDDGSR